MPASKKSKKVVKSHTKTAKKGSSKSSRGTRVYKNTGVKGVTDSGIKRLARRAGIVRMEKELRASTRRETINMTEKILADAMFYTRSANRTTVMPIDIVLALQKNRLTAV